MIELGTRTPKLCKFCRSSNLWRADYPIRPNTSPNPTKQIRPGGGKLRAGRRGPPNRPDTAGGYFVPDTEHSPASRYKAIYSTPSTVGSSIPLHPTSGLSFTSVPSLSLDDFPPLLTRGHRTVNPVIPVDVGRRKPPKRARLPDRSFPLLAVKAPRLPALLVKGPKPYVDMVKNIKESLDPKDFDYNVHFNRSRKGEMLIRFDNNETREEEIKRMKSKLSDLGSEVVRSVAILGRLDRILILDLDPSITEDDILKALKAMVPEKWRETIKINGLWTTSSGYAKALASVPRGVLSAAKRIKVGFFLCRIRSGPPPPPRCYKCHDFGHFAKTCEGPDVGGTCRRCAGGHPTRDCTEGRDKCVVCDRRGIPPSMIPVQPGVARGRRRVVEPSSLVIRPTRDEFATVPVGRYYHYLVYIKC